MPERSEGEEERQRCDSTIVLRDVAALELNPIQVRYRTALRPVSKHKSTNSFGPLKPRETASEASRRSG